MATVRSFELSEVPAGGAMAKRTMEEAPAAPRWKRLAIKKPAVRRSKAKAAPASHLSGRFSTVTLVGGSGVAAIMEELRPAAAFSMAIRASPMD